MLVVDGPEGTARHSRPDTEVLASRSSACSPTCSTRQAMVVEPNFSPPPMRPARRAIESRAPRRLLQRPPRRGRGRRADRGCDRRGAGRACGRACRRGRPGQDGVEHDEARENVDALVDARAPPAAKGVLAQQPMAHVTSSLNGFAAHRRHWAGVRGTVGWDAAGLAIFPEAYGAVATTLLDLAGDDGATTS